jgi:UDP-N-acetylglucosamine:LPS N-acetylglucosamine transferase
MTWNPVEKLSTYMWNREWAKMRGFYDGKKNTALFIGELEDGPRLATEHLDVPAGVDVKGYIPALHEHFAASDLCIAQGGGTTALELTALRRPFLCFPLEGHFEQQVHVAKRLARLQAGVRMSYSQTTPNSLAEKVISSHREEVTYPPIATDGAQKAAQIIGQLL